ncbi:low molecular weight protein-tyrosine-phosphatase [Endozoicomonas sp. SESOKO1]|uniref:low molecular weight protein-tyrosine-phosphatase n=1 Tax=Endozoicomonas sp. SESOKO1 TaxID=2828742 RepID=UPI00214802E7|nr:low molecular weight protein-tyrosine-phosphatase [Endozoicomonas sp. SESOKO1]
MLLKKKAFLCELCVSVVKNKPMFNHLLIVCVGNICRSPTAEYLLKKQLQEKGATITVESAGIAALVGKPASPTAVTLAAEAGVDMTPHRARQLTPGLIRSHDLILVMEQGHIKAVESMAPEARGKVHLLGRWQHNIEIPDPYRQGDAAYQHALELIQKTTRQWASKLSL